MKSAALFLGMISLAAAGEPAPLKLVQTIPLPGGKGRFDHFSVDVKGQRLFIAALGNNTLEVIDLAAGKRLQSISGMSKPTGVVFLADANLVLAANGDDGTLKILDATTCKVRHLLKDLPDADNLRLDPKSKFVWLGYGDGALALIDPSARKAIASVKLSGHPESFQLERQGTRMFINVPDAKQVVVVDRDRREVAATLPMGKFQANFPMALDESNHRLFIGCRRPARLLVLDTDSGKSVTDLEISGDTDDLFYDAKRARLYVSCGEGFIDVIEQSSPGPYNRLAKIPTSPGARTSFFSPDLDRYYLAVPTRGNREAELRVYQPE